MNAKMEDIGPLKAKKPWQTMKVSFLGSAVELIKGGGGKLSAAGGDTGDTRKPAGGGG
jgi:hypothetical protein